MDPCLKTVLREGGPDTLKRARCSLPGHTAPGGRGGRASAGAGGATRATSVPPKAAQLLGYPPGQRRQWQQ